MPMPSHPIFLMERVTVPAAVYSATGVLVTPGQAVTQREVLKTPEKMRVDYIHLNPAGYADTSIIRRQDIQVSISDKNRTVWAEQYIPLENLHNMIRERVEANQWGEIILQEIAANNATYDIPAGKWQAWTDDPAVLFRRQFGGQWYGAGTIGGVIESDGSDRVQAFNTDAAPHNLLLQRIEGHNFGTWWLAQPFRLEHTHSITLNIQNRMAVPARFKISFQAIGEKTGRLYLLTQEVNIAAGARQKFSGSDLTVTFEEAVIIKQMAWGPHIPPAQVWSDTPTEITITGGFDPEFIDLQIIPSQGNIWSEECIPLTAYANLRGQYGACFHKPCRELDIDVNDFLNFKFQNFDVYERIVHVVLAGYTI